MQCFNQFNVIHWSLIVKRIFRRFCYIFKIRELIIWPYESCERCGHCFHICWTAKDDKWIEVYGNENGCLCLDCFIELANAKNIDITQDDIEFMKLFNPKD